MVSCMYTFVKTHAISLRTSISSAIYSKKEKSNENDILVKCQRPRTDFRLWATQGKSNEAVCWCCNCRVPTLLRMDDLPKNNQVDNPDIRRQSSKVEWQYPGKNFLIRLILQLRTHPWKESWRGIASQVPVHYLVTMHLWSRYCYFYSHFTLEETDLKKLSSCSRLLSYYVDIYLIPKLMFSITASFCLFI